MSIKDKLIFCGNSSIDHIVTHRGTKDVIGGSAVNAAIAESLFGNKKISIISSIGYDFPLDILDKLNINTQYIQQYENKTNSFSIEECYIHNILIVFPAVFLLKYFSHYKHGHQQ